MGKFPENAYAVPEIKIGKSLVPVQTEIVFRSETFGTDLLGFADFFVWVVLFGISPGQSDLSLAGLCPEPCWGSAPVPASGKPPLDPALRGLLCASYPALQGAVGVDTIFPYFLSLISYFLFHLT